MKAAFITLLITLFHHDSFSQSEFNGNSLQAMHKSMSVGEALTTEETVFAIRIYNQTDLDLLVRNSARLKYVNDLEFLSGESFYLSEALISAFELKSILFNDARHLNLMQVVDILSIEKTLVILRFRHGKSIPRNIGLLKSLMEFEFAASRTRKIPPELVKLPLKTLNFSHCTKLGHGKALDETVFDVENLSFLNCGLRKFPARVLCSEKLRVLSLSENKLKVLPQTPCSESINSGLTGLYLDDNPLEIVPVSFFADMNELQHLFLGGLENMDSHSKEVLEKGLKEKHPSTTIWRLP